MPAPRNPGRRDFFVYKFKMDGNYGDALNSQRFSVAITGCAASHASEILQPGCDKTT